MEPTKKKSILITIVLLLIIFVPLCLSSFVFHVMEKNNPKSKDAPLNGEFHQNNKLNFYDEKKNYLNSYGCINPNGLCDYATSTLNDTKYGIDFYQGEHVNDSIPLIHNRYAFLVDQASEKDPIPFLYDAKTNTVLTKYSSVKNYGVGILSDLYIVGNTNGLYGILSMESSPLIKVKLEYNFIGLVNFIDEDTNLLLNDFFVALKGNKWFLIDANGAILTESISREIVSFNGSNLITKNKQGYVLVDYQDNSLMGTEIYRDLSYIGKYIAVYTTNNTFYLYDLVSNSKVSELYSDIKTPQDIKAVINTNGEIEIIKNDTILETIANS